MLQFNEYQDDRVGIATSFNEWKEDITDSINRYNMGVPEGAQKEAVFLDYFRGMDTFMTAPVCKIDNHIIEAKSVKGGGEQEVIDFINETERIVPYQLVKHLCQYIFRYSIRPSKIEVARSIMYYAFLNDPELKMSYIYDITGILRYDMGIKMDGEEEFAEAILDKVFEQNEN